MPSYLLDSDVVIEYFKASTETVALVEGLGPKSKIAVSVLTVIEVKSGAMPNVEQKIERFFRFVKTVNVNLDIANLASHYMKNWKKKGKTLYLVDASIAATCVLHDLILVTYNKKDYPIKELEMI